MFDRNSFLNLATSLIEVSVLIFCAKGNPIGQVLVIIFSIFYGVISYYFKYYGEMITYLCMIMPMAIIALVSWLKNPYDRNKAGVKVNRIKAWEYVFMGILALIVTAVFYFILKYTGTANLLPSTISVITSFAAVYFTARRSPDYAIAYAMNDVVLIVLWTMASLKALSYVSVVACFVAFLVNDIYGYINRLKMEKRQTKIC